MMICLGGVCIPLNLLVPFLVGVLHRYGWFRWFKQEWVTLSYWKRYYSSWSETSSSAAEKPVKTTSGLKEDERGVQKAVDAVTPKASDDEIRGSTQPFRRTEESKDKGRSTS